METVIKVNWRPPSGWSVTKLPAIEYDRESHRKRTDGLGEIDYYFSDRVVARIAGEFYSGVFCQFEHDQSYFFLLDPDNEKFRPETISAWFYVDQIYKA